MGNPALATAFGHLPGYWPEKLGAIAYFETMSTPFSHRSIQQLRLHGIDPAWYVVHRSIDNPVNGHSATILDAIVDYVESEAGKAGNRAGKSSAEAQLAQRVFFGFLLYETSFTMLESAAKDRLEAGAMCPRTGQQSAEEESSSCRQGSAEPTMCPNPEEEWMLQFVRR